jgi:hypothetical protein
MKWRNSVTLTEIMSEIFWKTLSHSDSNSKKQGLILIQTRLIWDFCRNKGNNKWNWVSNFSPNHFSTQTVEPNPTLINFPSSTANKMKEIDMNMYPTAFITISILKKGDNHSHLCRSCLLFSGNILCNFINRIFMHLINVNEKLNSFSLIIKLCWF